MNETKLPCGCYAENGVITAEAFLCEQRHKQGERAESAGGTPASAEHSSPDSEPDPGGEVALLRARLHAAVDGCEKAADTFVEMALALDMLRHQRLAEACRIAEAGTRAALAAVGDSA